MGKENFGIIECLIESLHLLLHYVDVSYELVEFKVSICWLVVLVGVMLIVLVFLLLCWEVLERCLAQS